MANFFFDTETYPIRPGLLIPKMVCLQYSFDNEPPAVVLAKDAQEVIEQALATGATFVAHNLAYDFAVLMRQFPTLGSKLLNALADGRGHCTWVNEKLLAIADGRLQDDALGALDFSLAGLLEKRKGVIVDKGEETYRLKYALVDGVPVDQWPEAARNYALDDVTHLRTLYHAQAQDFYHPPDTWFHTAVAVSLQLAAAHGLRTDESKLIKKIAEMESKSETIKKVLQAEGLVDEKGTRKTKLIQERVIKVCQSSHLEVPRNAPTKSALAKNPQDEGSVKTTAETFEELAPYDPLLSSISEMMTADKMVSTYLEPMLWGTKYAMTSRPNVLVASGRTSWSGVKLQQTNPYWADGKFTKVEERAGTNLQNFPQMPGIRECVVPRKGYVFASVDYGSLELRTLGQVCLWLFGASKMAEGFQKDADFDAHSYFGGQLIGIDYEEALRRKKEDPTFKNGPRKIGKAINFSLPGGVGPKRFAAMSLALYKAGELEHPISLDEARMYKEKYLEAYPEMALYFRHIELLTQEELPLKQFVSNRVRRSNRYTALANSYFQGLAADLAKRALWYVTVACYGVPESPLYGSRVVAFVHDEIICEIPEDRGHEGALEIQRLMVLAANEVAPDVPFTAEPALMKAWIKKATDQYDANGRLVPWKCKKCGCDTGCAC